MRPLSAPQRILHVPRRFVAHEWGGTETVLAELASQQQAHGYSPEIHTSLALSDLGKEIIRGIPVRRYGYCYPFFGLSEQQRSQLDRKGGNLVSLGLFASLVRAKHVRIFHAHTLKRLGGEVLTAARLRRKPFVVTLHGGVYDVPKAEQKQVVETQAGHYEWGKFFGLLFRSRRILEEADAVVCVGLGEYRKASAALGHGRVHHLGNGVNAGRFSRGDGMAFRRGHGIPRGALVVACYSRFDPQKDQLSLVEAFDRLAATHPRLHLVLAGPCTVPEYLAALDARIAASPAAGRIRRLGAIESAGQALPDAYHGCDIFALPSRHEPFGIVVLEAWCAGRPVAAANVGGLGALVGDGENGLLFPSGDVAAMAERIGALASSAELRAKLADAGRNLAMRTYTWERIAERTETIYQAAEAHCAGQGNKRAASAALAAEIR
ncbi:MAG TPA: glycosyltransferase family 4 protein [Chthoniobacteraceae bacterium]|jgi:glycosyltransferase involved in cell wall biosynthesis|nr:glycosyltransferase family 4 protein [Chthoniobacteraceae bacterium]